MSRFEQLLQKLGTTDGYYLRYLTGVEPVAGGIRVTGSAIAYRNVGDGLRPVILSNEPLAQQMMLTSVPNRPPDMPLYDAAHSYQPFVLDIVAYSPRSIRVRLGTEPDSGKREFGMVLPGLLYGYGVGDGATVYETAAEVVVELAEMLIMLQRDPFAIRIEHKPTGTVLMSTNEDRDVHGFLCTPLPGVVNRDSEQQEAYWSWALEPDEHLYGLGEHFNAFDQRGKDVRLWTMDAWGTTTDAAYKNVPFLLSSRHYGLFFHTPAPVSLKLGTTSTRSASAHVEEGALDLFVVFGADTRAILHEYTRLTGRANVPPRWAFGIWLSRCRYQSRAEVEAVARRAREEEIPCDVLHIDPAWLQHPNLSCDFTVNEEAFPALPEMVQSLARDGFKISLWELPYVSAQAPHYQEAVAAGYFLRDERGEPISADFGAPPADGYTRAIVDFTNPEARTWWQDLHRPLLQAGIACFKTDFGEGVPEQAQAFNGMSGRTLHNLFPLLYSATVHEVITEETGRPGMIWGRSGWAGIQRYPAQWGGDPKTDLWSMRASLRAGLGYALSAPGIWSHDIGGFYGSPPSPELYIRWTQFGMLSPLTRAHGTTPREPWEFGTEALANFKRYARLRMRLQPYLYATAWETYEQGLPMLRPLLLEFPADPGTATIDDVYLLGRSLLVAPVFSESRDTVQRTLYLPEGDWYDFWNDERVSGGRYIRRTVALDTIPLYVRAGTILPLGPEQAFTPEAVSEEISLEVYIGAEGTARVVWDEQGTSSHIALRLVDGRWQITITGKRAANWLVRWHTGERVIEQQLGYGNAATATLSH